MLFMAVKVNGAKRNYPKGITLPTMNNMLGTETLT